MLKTFAMKQLLELRYDGTFEGLLSCVFECYREQLVPDTIACKANAVGTLFNTHLVLDITTNQQHAARVQQGIIERAGSDTYKQLFKVFLSEVTDREMVIYLYLRDLFNGKKLIAQQLHKDHVWRVKELNKVVNREVHRMHAFVRFQETSEDLFFAAIEPDFDVLPLIGSHFVSRYTNMQWIIYDTQRKYGIHYHKGRLENVTLSFAEAVSPGRLPEQILAEDEKAFQRLWKDYFHATEIKERRNIKLHLKHVPRRYWKYLPEKMGNSVATVS